MKVTGWTWSGDPNYEELDRIQINDVNCPYDTEGLKAVVVNELRQNGYKFSGFYHQDGDYGAPVIDGKYQLLYSYREWGAIIEEAHPEHSGDDMAYCYWAWFQPEGEEMILPTPDDYHEE